MRLKKKIILGTHVIIFDTCRRKYWKARNEGYCEDINEAHEYPIEEARGYRLPYSRHLKLLNKYEIKKI